MQTNKIIFLSILFIFVFSISLAQKLSIHASLGNNFGFRSSLKVIASEGVFSYDKRNTDIGKTIQFPLFNAGIELEYKILNDLYIFSGIHSARTRAKMTFTDFDDPGDDKSFLEYGFEVNTYEIPFGIIYEKIPFNKFKVRSYASMTFNFISQIGYSSNIKLKGAPGNTDTIEVFYTGLPDYFPSTSSLGVRLGFGIKPLKKFKNWELGAYMNFQFSHNFIYEKAVIYNNISQQIIDYRYASIRDKQDYLCVYLKYCVFKSKGKINKKV